MDAKAKRRNPAYFPYKGTDRQKAEYMIAHGKLKKRKRETQRPCNCAISGRAIRNGDEYYSASNNAICALALAVWNVVPSARPVVEKPKPVVTAPEAPKPTEVSQAAERLLKLAQDNYERLSKENADLRAEAGKNIWFTHLVAVCLDLTEAGNGSNSGAFLQQRTEIKRILGWMGQYPRRKPAVQA